MVMKAYFATQDLAQRAADRLSHLFKVTGPEAATPVNGRPWRIEVTLPQSSMSQFPDPAWSSQVVSVTMLFDGIVHSQDQS
jgi:hypothetical protein